MPWIFFYVFRDVAKDVESYHDFDNLLNGLASKGFSLAERQEDFSLHFEACKIMLPHFFLLQITGTMLGTEPCN